MLLTQILPLVDVFLPNEVEAMGVAGTDTVEEALPVLAAAVSGKGCVVITVGAEGAVAMPSSKQGGRSRQVQVPAPLITSVVDPTGAGDAFNSGFLACYTRGGSLIDSMRCGTLTGSICIGKRGCCSDPPTPASTVAFAKTQNDGCGFLEAATQLIGRLGNVAAGATQMQPRTTTLSSILSRGVIGNDTTGVALIGLAVCIAAGVAVLRSRY